MNGAVECNGSQYNFSDFDSNLQSLFDEGKLPYLPISEFDFMVTNQGGCDSFGYKTPKMVKIYPAGNVTEPPFIYIELTDEQYSSIIDTMRNCNINDILLYRLYDINTKELLENCYLKCVDQIKGFEVYNIKTESFENITGFYELGMVYIPNEPIIIPDPDKSQADPTTYFKVPKKLSRVLVRTQKPTADNNYTWYNVYSDGFVEQGGKFATMNTTSLTISLPIEMSSNVYSIIGTGNEYSNTSGHFTPKSATTTSFTAGVGTNGGNGGWWEVSGYANSAEYTKDKWDYQNVQVERCMVQLFNSTTDTAVATCNQVLADISALKNLSNISEAGKENSLSWIFPDYSNSVNIKSYTSQSNQYTCPSYGWVFVSVRGEYKKESILYINNIKFSIHSGNGQNVTSGNGLMMPVRKNDTIYINDTDSETVCLFFPVGI